MVEEIKNYMTQEGKEKIEKELYYLKTEKRAEVVDRIKTARDFGDLSENSEYDAAKEEQFFVEKQIEEYETMLRHAVIIETDKENTNVVSMGKKVVFKELPDGDEEEYTIVGKAEANPFEQKISNDSPIAQSLLGKEIDDVVNVVTPGGEMRIQILDVQTKQEVDEK